MWIHVLFSLLIPLSLFALVWNQGFWTNIVSCFNIVFASAFAISYAGPLSQKLVEKWATGYYFAEFLCIWLIFILAFIILRTITSTLSKVPVRLGDKLDPFADWIGAVMVSVVMYSWVCFSLFAAPIASDGFKDMLGSGGSPSNMAANIYGKVVIEWPSQFGMGGTKITTIKYAGDRMGRANELTTKETKGWVFSEK
ncbi:MAG: hypothetical protein COA78_30690 [Blastopirellula sp.]|nr:MAG: hypothetical protein COA78_30690 [Blastopirellula sp.]